DDALLARVGRGHRHDGCTPREPQKHEGRAHDESRREENVNEHETPCLREPTTRRAGSGYAPRRVSFASRRALMAVARRVQRRPPLAGRAARPRVGRRGLAREPREIRGGAGSAPRIQSMVISTTARAASDRARATSASEESLAALRSNWQSATLDA